MGKEAELLFSVPMGTYFCTLEEYEPLIITFLLPIISRRNRKLPWIIKGSEWELGTTGALHT